nr:reverse transcriptase domain-containing protein [Tanacetum cinerariifolium]GEV81922.1 reverse transcriptase domain-containing protein [Tanacetum cinerariifolium]
MLSDIQETFERFQSINVKLNQKKCSFGVEEGLFLGHLITKQGIKANPLKIKAVTKLEQPQALKDIHSLNGKLATLSRFLLKGAERSLPFFKGVTRRQTQLPCTRKAYIGIGACSKKASKILSSSHDNGSHRDERGTPTDFLPEIPFDDSEKRVKEKEVSSNEWKLYTDGASSSDGAGLRLMLIDPAGKEYTYALRFEFETNNKAEYKALLAGLRIAQEIEIKKVAIFLDSQLVTALKGFEGYTVEHVRRSQNKKADTLSKLASMTFEHLTKKVLVKVLDKRSIDEKEVLKIEIKEKRSWMSPIQEYLLSSLLPEDTKEARKISIQVP